jgi:beta-glucanase (GH16 family)
MAAMLAALAWAAAGAGKQTKQDKPDKPAKHPEGWKLTWADEFDYTGLPDPNKWDYEEGFVRNREQQYYTRSRKENARVEDGVLVIEGRKERFRNARGQPGSKDWPRQEFADYTAASLITRGKAAWCYGRVEVRAKLPQGKGVWPAIWMLGTNISKVGWPRCGEIDIMEFVGHTPNLVHGTMHYAAAGRHRSKGGRIKTQRPFDDFHVYAVEWFPDRMDFYFDKTQYFTFKLDDATQKGDNCFRKPHYLLINLALGGSWGRAIDDRILPQKYLIDYVRIYERAASK